MVPGARDLRVNGAACAAEKRVCKLTKTKRPSPLTQPTSLEISLTGTITLETPVIECNGNISSINQSPGDTCHPKPRVRIERCIGDAVEYEAVIASPIQVVSCVLIG